ncbi:MAG TPA: DUF192 domain-containing protein [Candidatus Binataceae bacterium]|nr:DUF192 domain-containing protein [Candidatus Binataceae bacterium]
MASCELVGEVIDDNRGTVLCRRLVLARSTGSRMRGLLGRAAMEPECGMLFLTPAWFPIAWMHTCGMRFAIDIVFLDGRNRILRINRDVAPWRFSALVPKARRVLELAAGSAARAGCQKGDLLRLPGLLP